MDQSGGGRDDNGCEGVAGWSLEGDCGYDQCVGTVVERRKPVGDLAVMKIIHVAQNILQMAIQTRELSWWRRQVLAELTTIILPVRCLVL